MKHSFLPLIFIIALLTACSGSRTADEGNFKKAIEAYNKAHPLCLPMSPASDDMSGGAFGDETIRIAYNDAAGNTVNKRALTQMKILDNEDVYKQQKDETVTDGKARTAVFTLTAKGKKYFIGTDANPQLCIGFTHVDEVNWFSQPTADNGLTISRVSYRGQYDLHRWAKKLLKAGNPEVAETLDQPVNVQTTLVLTNKGWLDIRELN